MQTDATKAVAEAVLQLAGCYLSGDLGFYMPMVQKHIKQKASIEELAWLQSHATKTQATGLPTCKLQEVANKFSNNFGYACLHVVTFYKLLKGNKDILGLKMTPTIPAANRKLQAPALFIILDKVRNLNVTMDQTLHQHAPDDAPPQMDGTDGNAFRQINQLHHLSLHHYATDHLRH